MKGVHFLATFVFLAFAASFAFASDPSPLQDFCVAINDTKDGEATTQTNELYSPRGKLGCEREEPGIKRVKKEGFWWHKVD
ncbi:hypothetical protein NC651_030091 [Populus alba x Populus x berolinensis]|nr:hypothetical protein NC651_030091 [Populus alba x Populus x berolinensis]